MHRLLLSIITAVCLLTELGARTNTPSAIEKASLQDTITDPIVGRLCDIVFKKTTVYFDSTKDFHYSSGKVIVDVDLFRGRIEKWKVTYLALNIGSKLEYLFHSDRTENEQYPREIKVVNYYLKKKLAEGTITCRNSSSSNQPTFLRLPFTLIKERNL